MLTFEQFQATRRWVDDLAETIGWAADEPQPGFAYHADLHIFAPASGAGPDEYLLVIGNSQKPSPDLTELERDLYAFGQSEGMV